MKPKDIETICDEVAKEMFDLPNWHQVYMDIVYADIKRYWLEICRRYGIEVGKATLAKASEKACIHWPASNNLSPCVDKSTITDTDNIVLP